MRWMIWMLLVLACLGGVACVADADDKPAAKDVRVWNGYLWKDDEGHIQIGWPVVAMGVGAQPSHIVECPDNAVLSPLVTTIDDSFVFWNYRLENPIDEALPHLPRVLVRLRGPVTIAGEDDGFSSMSGGPRTMQPARLLTVEFVEPTWLEHWATVFREPASPWRIREKPAADKATQLQALAPKVFAALVKMRSVPGPTDAQKQIVRSIDERTRVVTVFRQRTEQSILRWLTQMETSHEIGLDLSKLGPLAPSSIQIQRWFLAAESKAAFLEQARSVWKGDLAVLTLNHYVEDGNSTSWAQAALDAVEDWDSATYEEVRKTTRRTVGE